MKKKAFTLVELLVVVAIIGILIAILLPALSAAKESVLSAKCLSVLRQHGMMVQLYISDFNNTIHGGLTDSNGDGIPDPHNSSEWEYGFSHKFRGGKSLLDYYGKNPETDRENGQPVAHSVNYNTKTFNSIVQDYCCPAYIRKYRNGSLVYYEPAGGQYKENPYRRGYVHCFHTTGNDVDPSTWEPFRGAPGWRRTPTIGAMGWSWSETSGWQKTWSLRSPPSNLVIICDYKFNRGFTDQVVPYHRGNGHRNGYGYLTLDGAARFSGLPNTSASSGWDARPAWVLPRN